VVCPRRQSTPPCAGGASRPVDVAGGPRSLFEGRGGIKAINDGWQTLLNRASVEGYPEAKDGITAAVAAKAGGAAASARGATQTRFAGRARSSLRSHRCSSRSASAKSEPSRDISPATRDRNDRHAAARRARRGIPLPVAIQLSAVQRDLLKLPSAVKQTDQGAGLLLRSGRFWPVEIQWSFTARRPKNPAQAFSLVRQD